MQSQIPLLLLFLVSFLGCKQKPAASAGLSPVPASAWFEDITDRAGIRFAHNVEASGNYLISEQMGSGGAFIDYDNDGRLDLYLVNNVTPSLGSANRLFHQEPGKAFKDVSAGSGLDVAGYAQGVAIGDVNNDGWPDVFITENGRVRLFLNQQGTGKFVDVTAAAGLTNAAWAVPAAFVDYDRDGWLDLVVGNYLDFDPSQRCPDARGALDFCGPFGFRPALTRLFHNVTARSGSSQVPRFEDVTMSSGLARNPGKAMGIMCADFDGDHWPDIFVTDDGLPNRLFINQKNGTFLEQAVSRGLAYTGLGATASNMGIALGDVDGDGLFDVFVPHLAEENPTLWAQGPAGLFQDKTGPAGLATLAWHGTGFAPALADFDCDGRLDLALANGLVRRRRAPSRIPVAAGVAPFWAPYAQPAQLFANQGGGRFHEISEVNPAFCGVAVVGRGLLCGDIDNDGGLDLLETACGGPARLYRNTAAPRGHWLGLRVLDPARGGRDAYGAEVTVRTSEHRQWRLVQPGSGYCSSNDSRVHFGLGTDAKVDSIVVLWPDGTSEEFAGGAVDRYVDLRKGTGHPAAASRP